MADADQIMSDVEEQMMMEAMDRLEKSMNEMKEKHGRDLSEMKEMLQSLIDYASPSTCQKQSVGSIHSSSEQINRSSPSADAQMNLKLEEPVSDVKKLRNQMREESLEKDELIIQDEQLIQIEINKDPIVAKEHLNSGALEVLDEMPRLMEKEFELLEAFPNEVLLAKATPNQEAPTVSLIEEQKDLKIYEIGDSSIDVDMTNSHVMELCFDPGGGALLQVDDLFNLEDDALKKTDPKHCDTETTNMMKLCEVCVYVADVNQPTLHASKPDQVKVSSLLEKLGLNTLGDKELLIFYQGENLLMLVVANPAIFLREMSLSGFDDFGSPTLVANSSADMLPFDPGGGWLRPSMISHPIVAMSVGGNLLIILVDESFVFLNKMSLSSLDDFGILDDNLNGVIMRRSTLIEDNISAQVWDSYTGIILASIKPLGLLLYVSNDSEMHVLKSSAMIDHDEELGRLTWASYNQNYLAATHGLVLRMVMLKGAAVKPLLVLRMARATHAMMNAYSEKLVFDPGGDNLILVVLNIQLLEFATEDTLELIVTAAKLKNCLLVLDYDMKEVMRGLAECSYLCFDVMTFDPGGEGVMVGGHDFESKYLSRFKSSMQQLGGTFAAVQSLLSIQLMKTHNLGIETTQEDVYSDDFCDFIPSLTWPLQALGFTWLGITATTDHHHFISCHILFFYELVIDDP